MSTVKGVEDLGIFRVIGQPNLNFTVDREPRALRHQRSRCQDAIQTAVGGNAVTQVQQGEARYDVTCAISSSTATPEAIETFACSPSGERVSLAQLTKVKTTTAPKRSIAKAASATSPSSTACAAATSAPPSKKPSSKVTQQVKAAARLHTRLGRRIREPEARQQAPG
jgi:cobalt-zinc-cadmium resistance protein CzcA